MSNLDLPNTYWPKKQPLTYMWHGMPGALALQESRSFGTPSNLEKSLLLGLCLSRIWMDPYYAFAFSISRSPVL